MGGGGWQWQFRLPSRDFSDADELALLLVHDKDNSRLICPVTPVESDGSSCTLSADLSALKDTVESCRRVNWQVTLLARQKTTFYALPWRTRAAPHSATSASRPSSTSPAATMTLPSAPCPSRATRWS